MGETQPQYTVAWHKTTAGVAYRLAPGHPDAELEVLVAVVKEPRRRRVCRSLQAAFGSAPVAVASNVEQAQAIEELAVDMAVEQGEWTAE
jgi:hypothetical protein